LEPVDRGPGSVVYCAFCDGYCLPDHLSEEHKVAEKPACGFEASKKVFYRTRQRAERPSTRQLPRRFRWIPSNQTGAHSGARLLAGIQAGWIVTQRGRVLFQIEKK